MAELNGGKGRRCAAPIPTTPHSRAHSLGIKCGGAKLELAQFSTVGIKGHWKDIYNSEQNVWRSDSMVGEKITVVYRRAVSKRNVETFILIFPVL